jgi:hypothetical protein
MAKWSPGKRVVVLGAGATRGAEFVDLAEMDCLPPLNTDFFTQLQRIGTLKHQPEINGVLSDVLDLYGANFDLTLEGYFTHLESMRVMAELSGTQQPKYTVDRLDAMRRRLLDALSAVLEESADVSKKTSRATRRPCGFHDAIVERLDPKDTIISFNYDCVIDDSLRRCATGRWSARYGYGFPNPSRVRGHEPWDAESAPDEINRSVNLLKLHGSINWFPLPETKTGTIKLRQKPYKQIGSKDYEIVPPENVKRIQVKPVFQSLWANAELALRRAHVLTFIGFSFTPTDLHVDALFRIALAGNKQLKRVVIVNPSRDHRRRVRSVLATKLLDPVRLVQFDYLSEFAPHVDYLDP